MPKRHNKTGRSTGGERHIRVPHYLLQSPAWRGLSLAARAVFIEAVTFYYGGNNGYIALPTRKIAEQIGASKSTVARALQELDDAGFIACTSFGEFKRKDRRASEYRLTFLPCDRTHVKRTCEFMGHIPKSGAAKTAHRRDRTGSPLGQTKEKDLSRYPVRDRERAANGTRGPAGGTQIVYHRGEPEAVHVAVHEELEIPAFLDRRSKGGLHS